MPKSNSERILDLKRKFFDCQVNVNYLTGYPHALDGALQAAGFKELSKVETSDNHVKTGLFFQTFWQLLPDSPSIRQPGFFRVCDIAELFCSLEEEV